MKITFLVLLLVWTGACQDEGCPIDFISNGDSCYHFFDEPALTWWDAMSFCGMYGGGEGTLATVETPQEQVFLETELLNRFSDSAVGDFWLGGYDLVNEGTWVWVKKNEYINDYTHWGPGEPSGRRAENCLALYDGHRYNWNDAPCELREGYICEVPLANMPSITISSGECVSWQNNWVCSGCESQEQRWTSGMVQKYSFTRNE